MAQRQRQLRRRGQPRHRRHPLRSLYVYIYWNGAVPSNGVEMRGEDVRFYSGIDDIKILIVQHCECSN